MKSVPEVATYSYSKPIALTSASIILVITSVRPLTVLVIWLRDTHWPFRPTASVRELYTLLLPPSICGNIGPPNSEPNGDGPKSDPPNGDPPNGDRKNGSLNEERKNGSSKGERKNGVPAKKGSLSNALWMSPKRELNNSKGSVKVYPRREREPNGELKNGSLKASKGSLLGVLPKSGCSAGGGQTPCLSYS